MHRPVQVVLGGVLNRVLQLLVSVSLMAYWFGCVFYMAALYHTSSGLEDPAWGPSVHGRAPSMEDERKAAIEDAARQAVPAQAPPLWQAALDAAAMIGTYRRRDEPPRRLGWCQVAKRPRSSAIAQCHSPSRGVQQAG